jgi:hypothetical protein
MGFRIWRRKSIASGLRHDLSKRGVSLSVGRRDAWFARGMRGQHFTVGAPGTGLFWTETLKPGVAPRQGHSTPVILTWLVALIVLFMAMSFLR